MLEKKTISSELMNRESTFWEKLLFYIPNADSSKLESAICKKNILITGASFGIGETIAERLSNFPVNLFLIARNEDKLKELKEKLSKYRATIFTYSVDLRDELQVDSLLCEFGKGEISIDIFIQNAGKSIHRRLTESIDRFHDLKRSTGVNLLGPAQLLLGCMTGIMNNKGTIINVSALNVLLPPTTGWSAYQASKSAFDQWLQCLEPELRMHHVKIRYIYLPLVRTQMSMVNKAKHQSLSMSRIDAANAIIRTIYRNKRTYKPWGTWFPVFLNACLPGLWNQLQFIWLKRQ
jgi:short-subunit dehydrogenase